MRPLKSEKERLIYEDVIYITWFEDEETGAKISNPPDFKLRFYVKGRKAEVICQRQGDNPPTNCTIDEEGNIICFLPKNTFGPGRLWMEDMNAVECNGFPDNDYETIERWDTEIDYID